MLRFEEPSYEVLETVGAVEVCLVPQEGTGEVFLRSGAFNLTTQDVTATGKHCETTGHMYICRLCLSDLLALALQSFVRANMQVQRISFSHEKKGRAWCGILYNKKCFHVAAVYIRISILPDLTDYLSDFLYNHSKIAIFLV